MANCPAELDFLFVATLAGCVDSCKSEVAEEVVAAEDTLEGATEELLELGIGVSAHGPCDDEGATDPWAATAGSPDPGRPKACVEELQQDSSAPQKPWKGSAAMEREF